jgi:hypothetical protein
VGGFSQNNAAPASGKFDGRGQISWNRLQETAAPLPETGMREGRIIFLFFLHIRCSIDYKNTKIVIIYGENEGWGRCRFLPHKK